MCIEDVRLGRETYDNHFALLVPQGTSPRFLAANPNRVALVIMLSTSPGGGLRVGLGSAAIADSIMSADSTGLPNSNVQHMELNIRDHGKMITKDVFVTCSAIDSFAAVWESILLRQ